jgi:hypoxanthine phosphoribosyltransferase
MITVIAKQAFEYSSHAMAVVGLIGTFYYGIKSTRLQRLVRSFTWEDVDAGVRVLLRKVNRGGSPDVVLTLSIPGQIVSSLMMIHSLSPKTEYRAIRLNSGDSVGKSKLIAIRTPKLSVGISREILANKTSRILIVDSAVITGDLLSKAVAALVNAGVERGRIVTATLLVTEFAIENEKGPDVYWQRVRDTNYRLPWGNLSGPW